MADYPRYVDRFRAVIRLAVAVTSSRPCGSREVGVIAVGEREQSRRRRAAGNGRGVVTASLALAS
jgi:hypothetical protein